MSIDDIPQEEFDYLKQKTYTIGTNYFFLKFIPHLLVWSDIKVSRFILEQYKNKTKDCLFASRLEAYNNGKEKIAYDLSIDYWYSRGLYKLQGNFTIFWVLQLIKKFFPDKIILLFGFDMYVPEGHTNKIKVYDNWTDDDCKTNKQEVSRNHQKYISESLPKFEMWMTNWVTQKPDHTKDIYNCTDISRLKLFKKSHYKEILK